MDFNRISELENIGEWIKNLEDPDRCEKAWKLGLLTGWRKKDTGEYIAPNFERALVVDRIVEVMRPAEILEIGTGRGLGCIAAAAAAKAYDCNLHVTTIDFYAPDKKQDWAIQIDGENKVINASRNEIWSTFIEPDIIPNIKQINGLSTNILPILMSEGNQYDFIFIDGGHDPYTVIHDLTYATKLLKNDGVILLDDFAPLDRWALGISLAILHGRKLFNKVIIFHSEGLVYGYSENPHFPRGMVLLMDRNSKAMTINRLGLLIWKCIHLALFRGYRKIGSPYRIITS
tara:strand:+ start:695 stop:1558 length:864 start_codon:yes stop_codon:yes gene_type:complete